MHAEELEHPKYLEIKFYRLTTPLFNFNNIPLSGLYNQLQNTESKEYELKSKFKNFNIDSPNFINSENLLSITRYPCDKILLGERMETIITFVNNSSENLTLRDLRGILTAIESKTIKGEKKLDLNFGENKNEVKILPHKSCSITFNSKIKTASKFQLQIHCDSTSKLYDNIYFKKKQRNLIKDSTENYCIRNNNVIFHEFQKFNFEVYNPFSIKERFFNINVNQCFIHIKIKNVTDNILTINDLGINLKEKTDKVKSVKNIDDKIKLLKSGNDKIKLVKSLEEIKNLGHKNENDSKYISLQPKEELMALFKIEDPDIYYEKSDYILYISWLKKFDFDSKLFLYDFSNKLNVFNNYFKLSISEKPEGDIILNQNFRIVINLKTKNKNAKYNISISQESIQDDDDKSEDREIEIIDIIEKQIELNSKVPSNNFILICKSDILGNIYLPKLKFTLTEGDKNNPIYNIYDSLLSFNCVAK